VRCARVRVARVWRNKAAPRVAGSTLTPRNSGTRKGRRAAAALQTVQWGAHHDFRVHFAACGSLVAGTEGRALGFQPKRSADSARGEERATRPTQHHRSRCVAFATRGVAPPLPTSIMFARFERTHQGHTAVLRAPHTPRGGGWLHPPRTATTPPLSSPPPGRRPPRPVAPSRTAVGAHARAAIPNIVVNVPRPDARVHASLYSLVTSI
jgi:hypothetical protein